MKRTTSRAMITGLGGTGVAGAAILALFGLGANTIIPDGDAPIPEIIDEALPGSLKKAPGKLLQKDEEICLQTDAPFFEGAKAGCFGKDALSKWGEAHVLDNRGRAVTLNLAHPTDFLAELEVVRNCSAYQKLTKEGWYAASTREMRREAYFNRACGTLGYLQKAGKPEKGYFKENGLSFEDTKSLMEVPPFRIVEDPVKSVSAESAEVTKNLKPFKDIDPDKKLKLLESEVSEAIVKSEVGVWSLEASGQKARVQELAYADFNADGVGDILVFIQISAVEATASIGQVGYLEKKSEDSPVRFRR